MKASASLYAALLLIQVLPLTAAPVLAQALSPNKQGIEDEFDGRKLQSEYRSAYSYGPQMPAYSLNEVSESSRTLADGNQIKTTQTVSRYRDQQGRVRISYVNPTGNERTFIADLKANVAYLIRPNRHDVLRIGGVPSTMRYSSSFAVTKATDWSKELRTSLGLKDFDGIRAVGTLTETTFPAGVRGNDKEMVSSTEIWSSRELGLIVYSRTVTPADGERITRLENFKAGDVADALFAIPADYAVRDVVLEVTQPTQ